MSETIEDGGSAFPIPGEKLLSENGTPHDPAYYGWSICPQPGMSLRDWFAGQALIGILGSRTGFLIDVGTSNAPDWAYQVADAMLAARKAAPQ
jgi:hypothetical protein